jgi:hypothetical protein
MIESHEGCRHESAFEQHLQQAASIHDSGEPES